MVDLIVSWSHQKIRKHIIGDYYKAWLLLGEGFTTVESH